MSGNRTPLLMSVQAGMASGATVAVALRFYTRTAITRNVRWDDWFMLLALFFSWGVSGPGLVSAHYGMGRHMENLSGSDIPKAIMWVWVARLSTIVAFAFAKVSIACLLMRIVAIKKRYRYILYGSIVVNVCVSIIWFIMTVKCVPAHANWLGVQEGDRCIPSKVTVQHAYFAGAAHSALDLLYATLPVFLVWDLKLSARTKLGIACLLSMGLFACACSVKKITETARLGAAKDVTWEFTDLSIWNMVELNVGIICGSVPCIRPLFRKVWHQGRSVVTSSGGKSGGKSGAHAAGRGYGGAYGSGYGKMAKGSYGVGSKSGTTAAGHGRASLVPSASWRGGVDDEEGYHDAYMLRGGMKHSSPKKGGVGMVTSKITSGGDGDSEENILPMQGGGILQTTEVEVRYDGGGGSVVGDEADDGRSARRYREGSGSGGSDGIGEGAAPVGPRGPVAGRGWGEGGVGR